MYRGEYLPELSTGVHKPLHVSTMPVPKFCLIGQVRRRKRGTSHQSYTRQARVFVHRSLADLLITG